MASNVACEKQIRVIWAQSFQEELSNELQREMSQAAIGAVQTVLEKAQEQEVKEYLGLSRYERGEQGPKPPEKIRGGFFRRKVCTQFGTIPDLRVPKLRRGNKSRPWKVLTRYRRCQQRLLDMSLYLYVMGLSIRDLREALFLLMNDVLSPSAINEITLAVQAKVAPWRTAPIIETPPILIVDGVWVTILYPTGKMTKDRKGHLRREMRAKQRVILGVVGVWTDGRPWRLLHNEIAEEENEAAWKTTWQNMKTRGLIPEGVELVVSDGSKGVLESMKACFPHAELQRCTAHKVRGFERYLTYKSLSLSDPNTGQPLSEEEARRRRRRTMHAEAHHIFKAPTKAEAEKRLDAFVAKWDPVEPHAVHNLQWGIDRCFAFYKFDVSLHHHIRTTNHLERFFRSFRNKADEIGAFPNEQSCLTIFYLVMARDQAKHGRSP